MDGRTENMMPPAPTVTGAEAYTHTQKKNTGQSQHNSSSAEHECETGIC